MLEQSPGIEVAPAGARAEPFSASMDRRIEDNHSRVRLLQDMWTQRWGRLPNDRELQDLLDIWIRDEVLYREALERGLDRNDEIVRRRLTQKMRNLAFRLSWTTQPTREDLGEYLAMR